MSSRVAWTRSSADASQSTWRRGCVKRKTKRHTSFAVDGLHGATGGVMKLEQLVAIDVIGVIAPVPPAATATAPRQAWHDGGNFIPWSRVGADCREWPQAGLA